MSCQTCFSRNCAAFNAVEYDVTRVKSVGLGSTRFGCHCFAEARVIACDPLEDPVRMRITGRFADLGTNRCFKLILAPDSLQSVNTFPVYLVDGERELPLIAGWTGNIVRYDQMIELCDYNKRLRLARRIGGACCQPTEISLMAFLGADGPSCNGGGDLHVIIRSPLPKTTFVPMPDLTGPAEGMAQ